MAEAVGSDDRRELRGTAAAHAMQQQAALQAEFASLLDRQRALDQGLAGLRRFYLALVRAHQGLLRRNSFQVEEALIRLDEELRATLSFPPFGDRLLPVSQLPVIANR